MCDTCALLAEAGDLKYRRALTDREATHGELDRVEADFNEAEAEVAQEAAKVATKMRRQLLAEAEPLIKAGDVAGLARITASHAAELAGDLAKGADKAYARGIAHIREQADKARGTQLAERARTPKNAGKYIQGASALYSQRIADQMAAIVRQQAHAAIIAGEDAFDEEAIAAVESAMDGLLVSVSTSLAREAMGMGRQAGMEETASDIATLTYSALLDNNTCDVCAAADGEVYGDQGDAGAVEDGLDATPNPNCEGMAYGNVCRCVMIVEYRQ